MRSTDMAQWLRISGLARWKSAIEWGEIYTSYMNLNKSINKHLFFQVLWHWSWLEIQCWMSRYELMLMNRTVCSFPNSMGRTVCKGTLGSLLIVLTVTIVCRLSSKSPASRLATGSEVDALPPALAPIDHGWSCLGRCTGLFLTTVPEKTLLFQKRLLTVINCECESSIPCSTTQCTYQSKSLLWRNMLSVCAWKYFFAILLSLCT